MADTVVSAVEHALENQRIGGLQIRVIALCSLVQICDAFDVNSIGVVVPSLTHVWNLPGPAFTVAFLWSSIGILVGALSAGPIGSRRTAAAAAGQLDDIWHCFAAQRLCELVADADDIALFHWARHRRRLSWRGLADRRLRAAAAPRAAHYDQLYRRAGRRLYLRPTRRGAAAAFRVAEHLRRGRHRATADRCGTDHVAAGVAALSRRQAQSDAT